MKKEIYYFGKASLPKRADVDYYYFDTPEEEAITDTMLDDLLKSVDHVFVGTKDDQATQDMAKLYGVPFIADTNLDELERFYTAKHYQDEVNLMI